MKKVMSLLLIALLVAGLSISALAVASPTQQAAPEATTETAAAGGAAAVAAAEEVPTFDANTEAVKEAVKALDEADPAELVDPENETYGEIAKALAALNEKNGTSFENVKASQVFELKDAANGAQAKIKAPEKFLGLFKLVDGKWVMVADEADAEGNIVFTPEKGVVYVIFVADEAAPATGESVPYALIVAAVLLAGSAVVFFRKSRKANA